MPSIRDLDRAQTKHILTIFHIITIKGESHVPTRTVPKASFVPRYDLVQMNFKVILV